MLDPNPELVNRNPHNGKCRFRLYKRDPVLFWGLWIVSAIITFSLVRSAASYDFKSVTLYLVITVAIIFIWFLEYCLTGLMCMYSDTYRKLVAAHRLLMLYRKSIANFPNEPLVISTEPEKTDVNGTV